MGHAEGQKACWNRNVEVSDVPRYMKELIEFIETRHPSAQPVARED